MGEPARGYVSRKCLELIRINFDACKYLVTCAVGYWILDVGWFGYYVFIQRRWGALGFANDKVSGVKLEITR